MLVVTVCVLASKRKFTVDFRMNVQTFLTILALREKRAFFRWMKVWALIWGLATSRKILTLSLLMFSSLNIVILFIFNEHAPFRFDPNIVFMLR
jgi:hypothetical protein